MIGCGRRRVVVLVAVVALGAVVLLVVGLVVRPGGRRPVSAPAPTPAAAATSAGLAVRDGREVSVEELTVALPGAPFSCSAPLPTPPSGFGGYVSCLATVHEDYDGGGGDWDAQVGVAVLDEPTGDLDAVGADAFRRLYRSFFTADDAPVLADETALPVTVRGAQRGAVRHRARVVVDREDLTSAYDRLDVEVVRLRSGRVVAFFADVPNDSASPLLRAVFVAQASMTLR